jgi:hypothetical protein
MAQATQQEAMRRVTAEEVMRGNYSGRREIIFCSPLLVTIRGGGSYIVPLSHIFRGR